MGRTESEFGELALLDIFKKKKGGERVRGRERKLPGEPVAPKGGKTVL